MENQRNIYIIPVFRELLQNSDDAQSTSVQIYFETAAALRDLPTLSDFKPSDVCAYFLVLLS